MGCTCQRNNSLKNEKPEKRSETQETNSQRNYSLKTSSKLQRIKTKSDEEEILIFSEMLVNENKGDVLKYYNHNY